MTIWAVMYKHNNADGRKTASVAIVPGDTPQQAESYVANRYKEIGYELLHLCKL